jgi:hypothetical protein
LGASQRNKGAVYEREIVQILRGAGYLDAARNLEQTRSGGGDILVGKFLFECKRRARLSFYEWHDQAKRAAGNTHIPVVVTRGDQKHNMVVLSLNDFLGLLREMNDGKAALKSPVVAQASDAPEGNSGSPQTEAGRSSVPPGNTRN